MEVISNVMTTARLNVLHDARQSQNPAPRSALFLFNLDRWVFSSYDDPADQIMVMVVITQKAVMVKQLTISHSLTIVRSLRCQIV